jgi:hypothetical protein
VADGRPPQDHPNGGRRTLDAQWLAYLSDDGDSGDGADLATHVEFASGLTQFNDARYHDAHESFEHAWRATPYPDRLLALALSKLGAAFAHAQDGNRRGATKIAADALACLTPLPDDYAGIDVRALEASVVLGLRLSGGPPPHILPALGMDAALE